MRIDFRALTGRAVTVYGQTEVTRDLYDAIDVDGVTVLDEAEDVVPAGMTTDRPVVTFRRAGVEHRIECDYLAGCDGAQGTSRRLIPDGLRRTYERAWPFAWLGILSRTPPVAIRMAASRGVMSSCLARARSRSTVSWIVLLAYS